MFLKVGVVERTGTSLFAKLYHGKKTAMNQQNKFDRLAFLSFLEVIVVGFMGLSLTNMAIISQEAPQSNVPLSKSVKYLDLKKVQLQGRVVCLHEELHDRYGLSMPTEHTHVYGFKASDGKLYLLLENNLSGAIFQDKRVRNQELILSTWLFPESNIIDVISIKSIKEGKLHDLYYYCFICAIRTAAPGPCMCCQDEVEFIEKPLNP